MEMIVRKNITQKVEQLIAHLGMQGEECKKSWLVGYFLLLITPWLLIWSRGAADGITVAIGVLFLWRSFETKNLAWTKDNFLRVSIIAWLWLVLVVSPFSEYPLVSFLNALAWVRYILFYAAIRHWLLTQYKPIYYMAIMLAILLGFCAVDTLWQYITGMSLTRNPIDGSGRLTGPMDNVKVGIFIAKLLLPSSGLLLFFVSKHSLKMLVSAMVFILFCYGIILLSGERTAFAVASISIFSAVGLLAISDKKLRPICGALFVVGLVGVGLLLYTQIWLQERLQYTIVNLSDFKNSSYGQLFWVGYDLGKSHLLTGGGLKSFRELCLPYLESGVVNHCNLHPHNPYIEWFAGAGIVGLMLFCGMVIMLFRESFKFFGNSSAYQKIIPAMAVATCIMNFFPLAATQSFFSNWPAILLWFSIAVAFSAHNLLNNNEKET